jgi:hypothetical protein
MHAAGSKGKNIQTDHRIRRIRFSWLAAAENRSHVQETIEKALAVMTRESR